MLAQRDVKQVNMINANAKILVLMPEGLSRDQRALSRDQDQTRETEWDLNFGLET